MGQMTRTERLLRLARLRGDRAAVAILEGRTLTWNPDDWAGVLRVNGRAVLTLREARDWTEAELRAAWGDR